MIDLNDIKGLLKASEDLVLSLYLNVDPALQANQSSQPAWRIYAHNALADLDKTLLGKKERAVWEYVHPLVRAYLNEYTPKGKGLVLFYGADMEAIYELPVAPQTNAASFGPMQVAPLLWLIDEYEKYLVVLVDSEEAQFLTTYLGTIDRQEAMASDRFAFDFAEKTIMPRPTSPQGDGGGNLIGGSNKDQFDDKIDEYIAKFHRDVAERVRTWLAENGVMRVVIGGNEQAAHAVYAHLHQQVQAQVVKVMPIPFQENDADVMQRVTPVGLEFERQQELELVESIIGSARANGRGALGIDAVSRALQMQQVELLIAAWPLQNAERFHELTLKAFQIDSAIELVSGEAADHLREHDGVAARLYYAITEA